MNTAIRANAAGIGFAIPIDTAERAVRILAEGKRIPHAYLGISMSTLTEETARQNNAEPNSNVELPVAAGALVLNIGENSPAETAGFRRFDVITELNGKAVRSAADAQALVDASPNHDPNPSPNPSPKPSPDPKPKPKPKPNPNPNPNPRPSSTRARWARS